MLTSVGVEASSIETLASALFHQERPDATFMVMTAYLDESGTHGKQSPVVIVAGFIANAEGWGAYERDLRDLLSRYNVKRFHAKRLRARSGDFKGWTRKRQAQFNTEFLRLADAHLAYGFGAALSPTDYAEIYKSGGLSRKIRQDTEYGLAFRVALWAALEFMADRKEEWPLNIVLESGHRNSADAIRIFAELVARLRHGYEELLGMISFGAKEQCLPLAVADSLAHSMFRTARGASRHPNPDVMSVGPTNPPHVTRVPAKRITITRETLVELRIDLLYQRATTLRGGSGH